MGNCRSTKNIESDENPCPICYNNMKRDKYNRRQCISKNVLISPCCKKEFHQLCWTKCLNLNGHCPLCRYKHIPDKYMKHIRFSIDYEKYHNRISNEDALSITFVWGKPDNMDEKDDQGKNILGNSETICFTDDIYWDYNILIE